jgi:hypothetical protein
MPARVHALIVVRPDGRTLAVPHLRRTLKALQVQSRPVDRTSVVVCGADASIPALAEASAVDEFIAAERGTSYADAVRLPQIAPDTDVVWLLAQDTAPEPDALARLAAAIELSPSVAGVAPKLVEWSDRDEIVSLGSSMTRLGASVPLVEGELDQGQHDADDDVLGADVRGMLVRTDAWQALDGIDPALGGADEGLDLGVRARLAGGRVGLAPTAVIAVAGDGVAGLPARDDAAFHRRFAARRAQLHRRFVYARGWALPLLWLATLPIAVWRTVVELVSKTPGRVIPEWGAAFAAMARMGAVGRARAGIRRTRTAPWSRLAPLRVTRAQQRHRFDPGADDVQATTSRVRGDLRFFSGGGAWVVLAALVASIAAFPALLAWPALGGGALQPLRSTVGQLWADAAFGLRATGFDTVAPADPFSGVAAVLGSLWPGDPSRVLVVLWVLALPLAVLGGWFAATRVTDRALLRIVGGVGWALAPTFLTALVDGRPTAVIVHLLLPWLFFTASVAHRSWGAAGAASLVLVGVVACAPSLAPALAVLWLIAVILTAVLRRGRGIERVVWLVIPTVVVGFPLVWRQLHDHNLLGLLADPGVPWAGPQVAADASGRALLAAGFPTTDPGGWGAFSAALHWTAGTWWVPLLVAPLGLLALLAPLSRRWLPGIELLVVAGLGLGTSFAAVGIAVASAAGTPVAVWPGAGLSLAWLGALGAALVTLDAGLPDHPGATAVPIARAIASAVVLIALCALALPSLTASARGTSVLTDGPASTLPAYVQAAGKGDPRSGTIVLTPLGDGSVSSTVVWGESETLGGHSTVIDTRTSATAGDREVAALTGDLVTTTSRDVVPRLAARGIAFVLLAPAADPDSDVARAFRLQAETSLDQRDGLDAVGQTPTGTLWRIGGTVTPRAAADAATQSAAGWIAATSIAVLVIALLLAVPTTASRRRARLAPRVVGERGDAEHRSARQAATTEEAG